MKDQIERLVSMLCNEKTDPATYEFVVKKLEELINESR